MKKLLLLFMMISISIFSSEHKKNIKIALFPLKPLLFKDNNGNPNGFIYDIIEYIAKKHDIETTYVFGSRIDSLQNIVSGRVDLMTTIDDSEYRVLDMDYENESIYNLWGQVYSKPNANINTIFDLQNKKIGILRYDSNGEKFIEMINKFKIKRHLLFYDKIEDAYKDLNAGKLDSVVYNIIDNYSLLRTYNFEKTPIIFNPQSIYFTVAKGKNREILSIFSEELKSLKSNDKSYYYERLNYWTTRSRIVENQNEKYLYYQIALISSFALFFLFLALFYNRILKKETLESNKQQQDIIFLNNELEISNQMISQSTEGFCITDSKGVLLMVNDSFGKLSGYNKEELLGKQLNILKSGLHDKEFYQNMWKEIETKGSWSGEIWNKKKNGEIYPKLLTINTLKNKLNNDTYYFGISSDISKIKESEKKIKKLAYSDSLTGLSNRALFYEILEKSIKKSVKTNKILALLFLDLDKFKLINDTFGHTVGDKVLVEVAEKLRKIVKNTDTVSRLGGDEFTIILEDIPSQDQITVICQRIVNNLSQNMKIHGIDLAIGVSIGIAMAPFDDVTLDGLIIKADSAMYNSKEMGRGLFSFYSKEIQHKNESILFMESKIKKALKNDWFKLKLQPKVLIKNDKQKIFGAEALIRLELPEGNVIMPDKFIKISEDNGLIIPIGQWVIEEACRMVASLKKENIDIHIAINISIKQFRNKDIINIIKTAIISNELNHDDIELEITESVFHKNSELIIDILNEIKALGIKIGMDDFGMGFSSLSSLSKLPIDYLKIDKSFIDKLGKSEEKELVSSIISIAKNLDLSIVAEGVETKEQVEILSKENMMGLQGYYYSKPLELSDFIKYYKEFNG